MSNRKKSKKAGKKSSQAKRISRRKPRSESANSSPGATLVLQSTAFLEPPAPAPSAPAPSAPMPSARTTPPSPTLAHTTPASVPPTSTLPPSASAESPLSTFRTPLLRMPPPDPDAARIVKHSPPSAGEVMRHEPAPAPKPKSRARARSTRTSRPPLPEKLTHAQLYETLAALLVPYARRMESEFHPKLGFCLKARSARNGREAHFGGVQALADGVALHFFPLYGHPELLEGRSPELVNRLRSQTHFHFEELSASVLDELGELIREGFERFVAEGMA